MRQPRRSPLAPPSVWPQTRNEAAIDITGDFTVTAPRAATWNAIMDPATLCRLATSCQDARRIDETHYAGTIRVKLGILSVTLLIRGEVLEARPPEYLRIKVQGESSGLPGNFRGEVRCWLDSTRAGTAGRYSLDISILGRLGSFGGPLFQSTAQRIAHTFAEKLSQHLASQR